MTPNHMKNMLNKSEYRCKVLCKTGRLSRKKEMGIVEFMGRAVGDP
jgi:hypothetical protein